MTATALWIALVTGAFYGNERVTVFQMANHTAFRMVLG
jgi:hypothetical protein